MFDFFFKRRRSDEPAPALPLAAAPIIPSESERAHAKQRALARAEELGTDEEQAAEFLLTCDFADARLLAAQRIQSQALLERLLTPMRRSDRRVARLLQQRLDRIKQLARLGQQVQLILQQGRQLLQEPHLLPNHVVELDTVWQALAGRLPQHDAEFEPLRQALDARLHAQGALQRTALDTLARLKQMERSMAEGSVLPPAADVARALAILEGAMANHFAAPEAAALPRQLQRDFEQQRAACHARWRQLQITAACEQALADWQMVTPEVLPDAVLRQRWQLLLNGGAPDAEPAAASTAGTAAGAAAGAGAAVADAAMPPLPPTLRTELQQRFDAWLAARTGASAASGVAAADAVMPAVAAATTALHEQGAALVDALEAALAQGSLQVALDCEQQLQALESQQSRAVSAWPRSLRQRWHDARAELARLRGWARWGGNVSRTELLAAAQRLPQQTLPVAQLAQQVGALRARWKALNASAGAAPAALWQQFDAACTLAYAPAAVHFAALAEQRRQHLLAAEALIGETADYARACGLAAAADAAGDCAGAAANPDWKALAQFVGRQQQAWQRLGTLQRQDRKRLQRRFDAALQPLLQPLAAERQRHLARRQQLIEQAQALAPSAPDAAARLQALQQDWQQQAQALPLERREEQALWHAFRTACDQVFAQRRQAAASAEQQRHAEADTARQLCADLEQLLHAQPALALNELQQRVAANRQAWAHLGPLPRAEAAALQQRHATAVALLQRHLLQRQKAQQRAEIELLRVRLALCQQQERQLAACTAHSPASISEPTPVTDWQREWAALAPAAGAATTLHQALDARFAAGSKARLQLEQEPAAAAIWIEQLRRNVPACQSEVLRLEIISGVDSPPQLARARLQLQVGELAAKLKNGASTPQLRASLQILCGLPALTDAALAARIERVLQRLRELPV